MGRPEVLQWATLFFWVASAALVLGRLLGQFDKRSRTTSLLWAAIASGAAAICVGHWAGAFDTFFAVLNAANAVIFLLEAAGRSYWFHAPPPPPPTTRTHRDGGPPPTSPRGFSR
jgi:hypothetical protein